MCRSLILLLAAVAPLTAQDVKPAEFATKAAPFIDDQTLVVVRADLTKIQVEPFFGILATLRGDEEETAAYVKETKAWLTEFTRKGGREVFITYGANDFPNQPVLLIPIGDSPEQSKDLGELIRVALGRDETMLIEKIHGCMAVGQKPALDALKARKPAKRPDLEAALAAGKNESFQMAMALSEDARKIFEQIAPTLPEELGGGAITKMTRGIKWSALTIGLAPDHRVRLSIDTDSPESLTQLAASQEKFTKHLVGLMMQSLPEELAAMKPKFEKAFAGITAKNEGSIQIVDWNLGPALRDFKKDVPLATSAQRLRSMNNLKQLALALHSYHDVYGHFPTDIKDKNGKPLFSWRVRLLPYLEQNNLYKTFKLDEPWDSAHNKHLSQTIVKVFVSPRQKGDVNKTTYLAPLGDGFMWDQPKGTRLADVPDGTSNTILLLETNDEQAVEWTKPGDLKVDLKNPVSQLMGHYPDGFVVLLADGSVQFLKKNTTCKNLMLLLQRGDGNVIPTDLTKDADGKDNLPLKK